MDMPNETVTIDTAATERKERFVSVVRVRGFRRRRGRWEAR